MNRVRVGVIGLGEVAQIIHLPILRMLRPTRRVAALLKWEGIVVDPIGAILAVLVFQTVIISGPEVSVGPALVMLGRLLLICTALTLVFGIGLEVAMRRHWIPDFLEGVVFLAAGSARGGSDSVPAQDGAHGGTPLEDRGIPASPR